MNQHKFGCILSRPDARDLLVRFTDAHIKAFDPTLTTQPPSFDLRSIYTLPPHLAEADQHKLACSSTFAVTYAIMIDAVRRAPHLVIKPSYLFVYYNQRQLEGTVCADLGGEIRTAIKSLNRFGLCESSLWEFKPENALLLPPSKAFDQAQRLAIKYARIDFSNDHTGPARISHLKRTLLSGYPICFAFSSHPTFESDITSVTGAVSMPDSSEQVIGKQAVCITGYNDTKGCFIVKNSWGLNWGLDGAFNLPFEYASDPSLCSDFWVTQLFSNPKAAPQFSPGDVSITPSTKTSNNCYLL
ncbi:Cathepsin B [uncultured virus]|nr:Cathepsin B [uncultured virus]